MIITIIGRPVSKKNSKQVFRNRKTGRMFFVPSSAYEQYKKDAGMQLLRYKRKNLTGELVVNYSFYQKGKLCQDFDNAIGSLNDILQEFEVIENDKNIVEGTYKIIRNAPDWKTVIEIIPLQNLS